MDKEFRIDSAPVACLEKPMIMYHELKSSHNVAANIPCQNRQNLKTKAALIYILSILIYFSSHLATKTNGQQFTHGLKSNNNNNDDDLKNTIESVRDWSLEFGRDISSGTEAATCITSLRGQYDPNDENNNRQHQYKPTIESIDWTSQHNHIVKKITDHMRWHQNAVEAICRAAEELSGGHQFMKNASIDYYDVHRLENLDEIETQLTDNLEDNTSQETPTMDAQPAETLPKPSAQVGGSTSMENSATSTSVNQPLIITSSATNSNNNNFKEFQITTKHIKLAKHPNFGDVAINTEVSAVHTPVHIYPGDPQIMNDIIWSDQLTKIFQENFVKNPKLTNQFFASQMGFLRLFPAQKWQVKHDDPDLYDARMRPWYVAAASSHKDVVILVDSSGSMTGSRRDIARGVVMEILDTLTDNDRFVVLKFSETVQQVGTPVCSKMRPIKRDPSLSSHHTDLPSKNVIRFPTDSSTTSNKSPSSSSIENNSSASTSNETMSLDVDSFYLLPANKRNVRQVRANFNIVTSGIANFSLALKTAFKVLENHDLGPNGGQCNRAIMLITDGSPSDFTEIFAEHNYDNAPFRVFTYLIGREAGDVTHTKMMACSNKGYYTHVINLAEVRESVQQYIPVMARPLVLNKIHPITWTGAYGELTYQILTDWMWESKRREKLRLRQLLSASGTSSSDLPGSMIGIGDTTGAGINQPDSNIEDGGVDYDVISDKRLESIDLFGYNKDRNCFWQTHRNDLLTTVAQPVYSPKNESLIIEKFLLKNSWQTRETNMTTAKLLGVAAADMKINDIIALAPSHKLGPNGYAIMLTNNGFAMHHPDLRSILEPFDMSDPIEKNMRILKPYFSSIDFSQIEHVDGNDEAQELLLKLRKEAVSGLTGFRELNTKRAIDCQRRPQLRKQSFYYEPIKLYPYSVMIAVPQPYGSHRIEAQIELKSLGLPEKSLSEKLSSYFDFGQNDLWTLHPDYQYCEGPSNNSITNILDMISKIEQNQLDDIQWKASESTNPPISIHNKQVCDKDLVQSLVYDAIATHGFSGEKCSAPNYKIDDKSSLIETYNVRFTFLATRSGLTRVKLFNTTDSRVREEVLSFAKFHTRAIDETFYSRTVDFNMLVNSSSVLIQVPFNTHEKIREQFDQLETELRNLNTEPLDAAYNTSDSISSDDPLPANLSQTSQEDQQRPIGTNKRNRDRSLFDRLEKLVNRSVHVISTQAIIVNEGPQRAVAGVTGVFYDYPSFVIRFFKMTNRELSSQANIGATMNIHNEQLGCGYLDDDIDCLLVDNNGYIIISEDLRMIGRSIGDYSPAMLKEFVKAGVFREIMITDYQAVCIRPEERVTTSSAMSFLHPATNLMSNLISLFTNNLINSLFSIWTLVTILTNDLVHGFQANPRFVANIIPQTLTLNKTYLRPCEQEVRLLELQMEQVINSQNLPSKLTYQHDCGDCSASVVYNHVSFTNLIMIVVDRGIEGKKSGRFCEGQPCRENMKTGNSITEGINSNDYNETQICAGFERERQLYRKPLGSCFSKHELEKEIKLCGRGSQINPSVILISFMIILLTSNLIPRFRFNQSNYANQSN